MGACVSRSESIKKKLFGAGFQTNGLVSPGLVLTLIIGFSVSRNIAGPLKALTAVAERIAVGDLSVNVSAEARSDEVGMLARTFEPEERFFYQKKMNQTLS